MANTEIRALVKKSIYAGRFYIVVMAIYYSVTIVASTELGVCKCDSEINRSCKSNDGIEFISNVMMFQGVVGFIFIVLTCITGTAVEGARINYDAYPDDKEAYKNNKENLRQLRVIACAMSGTYVVFIATTSIIIWVYLANDKNLKLCVDDAKWPAMYATYMTTLICVVTAVVYTFKYVMYRQMRQEEAKVDTA